MKEFAQNMIRDHQDSNKATYDLTNKLKTRAEKSEASKAIEKDCRKKMAELKKLDGHALDKAYLEHAVTAHQSVLDEIDKSLLSNVSNGELKALLEKSRPAVANHLEHARGLSASM